MFSQQQNLLSLPTASLKFKRFDQDDNFEMIAKQNKFKRNSTSIQQKLHVISPSTKTSSSLVTCRPYIPTDASQKEHNIHKLLNEFEIYTIDVKSMLAEESKKECTPSTKLQLAFKERSAKNSSLLQNRKKKLGLELSGLKSANSKLDQSQGIKDSFDDNCQQVSHSNSFTFPILNSQQSSLLLTLKPTFSHSETALNPVQTSLQISDISLDANQAHMNSMGKDVIFKENHQALQQKLLKREKYQNLRIDKMIQSIEIENLESLSLSNTLSDCNFSSPLLCDDVNNQILLMGAESRIPRIRY
eukprot:403368468